MKDKEKGARSKERDREKEIKKNGKKRDKDTDKGRWWWWQRRRRKNRKADRMGGEHQKKMKTRKEARPVETTNQPFDVALMGFSHTSSSLSSFHSSVDSRREKKESTKATGVHRVRERRERSISVHRVELPAKSPLFSLSEACLVYTSSCMRQRLPRGVARTELPMRDLLDI